MLRNLIRRLGVKAGPLSWVVAETISIPVYLFQWMFLSVQKESAMVGTIKKIQKELNVRLWPNEMAVLYRSAQAALRQEGDFAELGVFQGGSAKIFCEVKGKRPLHLFDTFEGLPEPSRQDSGPRKGQYRCDLLSAQKNLKKYPNVFFYKGNFPDTASAVQERTFSFLHLDTDLYQGTLDGLKFFYPRMTNNAIIIGHDYSTLPGVRRAFDEFFQDKPEFVLELDGNQCLVVKR